VSSPDFGSKEFDYGVGYPTPSSIPDDTSCWTIPVPNDSAWQAVLIGLLQTLTEEKSWQQYEGALSQEEAAARWADMVTEFLFNSLVGCGATPPPGIRYFADDDAVQIQEPDGDWVANPDADPRHSNSNKLPVIVSDNPQCDSSANIVAWIHSFIDTLITVKDETGLVTAFFLDVLELLWGAGIFLAIITLFIETLLFLGIDTVLDAFTDEVYSTLLCIFFCNLEADGSLTAEGLATVNSEIDSLIGGTVATVLHAMFFIMGEVGLSNAGSQGTETGDCGDCTCGWCYNYLWQSGSMDAWGVVAGQGGSFFFSSPYWVWDGTLVGSVPSSLGIETVLGDGTVNYHITDWSIEWAMADAFGTFNDFVRMYDKDNNLVYTFSPGIADGGSQSQIVSSFTGLDLDVARILIRGDARNYVVAINFNLTGDTVSPFDASNC